MSRPTSTTQITYTTETNKLLTAPTTIKFRRHWRRISDNFDLLYGKPENVCKRHQIVLQIAVQGKLIKPDFKDKMVSVLPEKIKAEKKRLIKDKTCAYSVRFPQQPASLPAILSG